MPPGAWAARDPGSARPSEAAGNGTEETVMKIERSFTRAGADAYADLEFTTTASEIRNPDRHRGLPAGGRRGARRLVAGRLRRHRAEVLPQGGRSDPAQARARARGARLPVALRARREGARRAARGGEVSRRNLGARGLRPAGGRLGLLGLEGRLLHRRGGRARLLRRDALHAGRPARRAQLAAVVQHGAPLGLRHRWARAGALLRRSRDGRADPDRRAPTSTRSRTPASSSPAPTTS